jgi:uncharacterized membrane protein
MAKIIRVLGVLVGLFFMLVSVLALFSQTESVLGFLSGFFTGLLFFIYGVTGTKYLGKIFPSSTKDNLW